MSTLYRAHASWPCDACHVVNQLHLGVPPNGLTLLDGEICGFFSALNVFKLDSCSLFLRVAIDSDNFAKVVKEGVDVDIIEFFLGHILNVDREAARIYHALRLYWLGCDRSSCGGSRSAHVAAGLGLQLGVLPLKLLHIMVATLLETSVRIHVVLLTDLVVFAVVVLVIVVLKIVISGAAMRIVASHHLIILALIVVELMSVASAHMTPTTVIVEVAITATAHVTTSSPTPTVIAATEASAKSWLLEPTTASSAPLTMIATSTAFTMSHVALAIIVLRTSLLVVVLRALLRCLN